MEHGRQAGAHEIAYIIVIACVLLIHTPSQYGCLFGRLAQFPCSAYGHILPSEAPPALCEHQQVQCRPPFLIVPLEVPARIGYESPYLAGQQHLGEDASVVVQEIAHVVVPHGERYASSCLSCFHPQAHRLVGCIFRLEPLDGECGFHVAAVPCEEESVGIHIAASVKYGQLIYPRTVQQRVAYLKLPAVRSCLQSLQPAECHCPSLMHEGECQVPGGQVG